METSCGWWSLPAMLWRLISFLPHRGTDQTADSCGLQIHEETFSQHSAFPDSVWLYQAVHTVLVLGSIGQSPVPALNTVQQARWLPQLNYCLHALLHILNISGFSYYQSNNAFSISILIHLLQKSQLLPNCCLILVIKCNWSKRHYTLTWT